MKKLIFLCAFFICSISAFAQQQPITNWTARFDEAQSFIENKGQFTGRNRLPGSEILYAVDNGELQIFFTKQGVTYYVEKKFRNPDRKKGDRSKPKLLKEYEVTHLNWEGANPNVELKGFDMKPDHHTYSFINKETGEYGAYSEIYGYKKLVYKNLYPNIDVEYVIHPQGGIKYSVILHPGADASLIKMKYSGNDNVNLSAEGKVIIPTFLGNIVEHAPLTFYASNSSNIINSRFIQHNKTISFALGSYNNAEKIVIDPWVQTPTLPGSNCVWECEQDAAGNVYIIGGETPMRLQKYNDLGVLQWTYNTPYDTNSGDWLGTLATDRNGNSYVTNGSTAALSKIGTNGGPAIYSVGGGGLDEYWSVQFNCDQTKLVVGGTRLAPFSGRIFDINANNGSVISNIQTSGTRPGIGGLVQDPNEVRAISSSRNGKYYYLTLDSIGAINQNPTACGNAPLFFESHGYVFGYKSENYRPDNGNSGICAIRANDRFVYTQDGNTLDKRSLTNGAIVASVAIPGGISVGQFGFNQPGNSGIDIDSCGNVYVGSADRVIKYDANLNVITSTTLPFRVFDVTVSTNGNIIVAGASGDNTQARSGYVQSINMSACAPFTLICCDATVCPVGPYCLTGAPVNLSPVQSGGTWSGPGITNSSAGTFSPSVAGQGVHKIAYTLPCGSDTVEITVNDCSALSVCKEPNGDLTVSGGTGPYDWDYYETGSTTPITNEAECLACGYLWFGAPFNQCFSSFPIPADDCVIPTGWAPFATGTTVTPPSYPVRVTDVAGTILEVQNATSVPLCTTVVCPTITIAVSAQTNVTCNGANNGSATVNATGGAAPYQYTWQPGNLTGATRNNLAPGTYSITATDANSCTGTTSLTITQPAALTLNTTQTPATCSGGGSAGVTATGGTSPYTYTWSNGGTTATITNIAGGNYTVTVRDVNSCSATSSVTVGSSGGPTVSLSQQTNVTCFGADNGAITITVTGGVTPYGYTWSNGATTQNISNLAPGSYTVTVRDNNNCTSTLNVNITEPAAIAISGNVTNASCGVPDGAIDIAVTGGSTPYSFSWSNNATTEDLTNVTAGNYTVTVTDQNSCQETETVTIAAPGTMEVSLTVTDASCQGVSNGSIASTVTGGNTPYTYNWSNGTTTANAGSLSEGVYTLTVTDASNCSVVESDSVGTLLVINLGAVINLIDCSYDTIGAIKLLITGGTPPYTAQWSTADTGLTITDLSEGNYATTVTDANGCQADSVFALISRSGLNVTAAATGLSCSGTGTGSVQAVVIGNKPPYNYLWNTGDSTATLTGLPTGQYSVTVTDSLGCVDADTTVVGISGLVLEDKNLTLPQCKDTEDGAIEIIITNGTTPYSYLWSNGQDSMVAINLNAGVYIVTVTDANNCVLIDSTVLNALEDCDSLFMIYDVFTPNGDGMNDLWIIDGLQEFPDSEVQIFNRWGSLVYESKPYLNDWDGRSKKGEPLPTATYYYILKLNDGSNQTYSGAISLIR
jgi:gliding motility-associated-like protein